jgi:hypothetical protein
MRVWRASLIRVSFVASFVTLLAIAVHFTSGSILATPASVSMDDASKIAQQTVYLQKPVQKFHRIMVEGDLTGDGKLTLDPNSCNVDEFGETAGCTKIKPTSRKVTFKLEKTEAGRKLYVIEGTELGSPLYLVVPTTQGTPYRLVYNDRGPDTPYPITLEKID